MIGFCRQKCVDNEVDLNYIQEFEDYYDASNAVFWYTRDTFLFRLLNKALREQDIDTLYSMRYFIRDLHLQLQERHISQRQAVTDNNSSAPSVSIVYRGQQMMNEEFDRRLRNNTGGFFSVSSFLSTTPHENLASAYAGGSNSGSAVADVQHVLFQIHIDDQVNKFPYADITEESVFQEAESEVLFTMGAVFRIQSVEQDSQGVWIVQLRLTGKEDEELRTLAEHMRKNIFDVTSLASLAKLMLEMGKHDKAEQFYLLLLSDPYFIGEPLHHAIILANLGVIYHHTGRQEKTIEHFEKSLEIKLKHLHATDPSLAQTYNNLGAVYHEQQGDYEKALSYYNKALEIDLNAPDPDQSRIAMHYGNIESCSCIVSLLIMLVNSSTFT
ncbi:unnamed protein product [Didymodactylos carnosus]|uniref:NAD(+)--protein-arginine ADP-ribosyltransferase n=1 Tax=Didymodactylos carnosus TaxID=1234261 RepID=A0A8S2F521_9BILA|nr:unnamed protein product [Didymodactylos carnosus]CAF4201789.1 unnamed protein product [Didymodactylos carnosus]